MHIMYNTDLINHIRVHLELLDKSSCGTEVALTSSIVQYSAPILCTHNIGDAKYCQSKYITIYTYMSGQRQVTLNHQKIIYLIS